MPTRTQNGSYRELTEEVLTYIYIHIIIYMKMVRYNNDIIGTKNTDIGTFLRM